MHLKHGGMVLLGLSTLSAPLVAHSAVTDKADSTLQKQLASPKSKGWTSVIVKTDSAPTAAQEAALTALGGDVYRHLSLINSVALRVPNKNLAKLAALPFVTRISWDGTVKKNDEFIVEHSGADVAWSNPGVQGTGVGVAVLDSGIRPHQDLKNPVTGANRLLTSVSFVPPPPGGTIVANDMNGHGTHIAGIIAGAGQASTGGNYFRTFKGVAPDANLVNVRVLDENGQGTVSQVISGLQWVSQNAPKYKIKVVNLSLGHPVGESFTTDPLCQAVEKLWRGGIVVVCAAGNDGRLNATQTAGMDNEGWSTAYGSIQSPANDPYVITVGATKNMDGNRANDRIATYSGRGPSRLDLILKPTVITYGSLAGD